MEIVPNLRLAGALERAALKVETHLKTYLESGSDTPWYDARGFYEWTSTATCNCGLVARELGVPRLAIENLVCEEWSNVSRYGTTLRNEKCSQTGLTLDAIFAELAIAGLTTEQIDHLEFLGDPAILRNITFPEDERLRYFTVPDNFVVYVREWARQIRASHADAVAVESVLV